MSQQYIEPAQWLHNMSAPPRSRVQVAPNRRGRKVARVWVPGIMHSNSDWRQKTLEYCGLSDWDEMMHKADNVLSGLPPFFVMTNGDIKTTHRLQPLVTIALLSRTSGVLFQLHAKPMYTLERMRKGIKLSDPAVLSHLNMIPIEGDS